jgi:hypothetical protein
VVHWAYIVNVAFWLFLLLFLNSRLKNGGPDTFGIGALLTFLIDAILVLAALCCHLIVRSVLHP